MHIIHVSPTYFDEASIIGGGERYVHELAKFQAKLPNTEVFIYSFGRQKKTFLRDGVRYRIFKALTWRHFQMLNPFSLGHILSLRHADVIHIHQLCTFVSDIAALAGRFWRAPVVGTDHGGGGAWVLNTKFPVYRFYQKVIAQSQQASEPLKQHFNGRIEVIPGGVDIERFAPCSEGNEAHKEILFIGRLLPHKGVSLLIEAFKHLDQSEWNLCIVGRAQDLSYFECLKESADGYQIQFATNLNDTAIVKCYQRASATVLPSIGAGPGSPAPELMGFTILESQACGTPVVCSDSGPMSEFIEEGTTGWVFESGSVDQLVKKLKEAIASTETHLPQVREACHQHVRNFSWETVANAHRATYLQLIESTY